MVSKLAAMALVAIIAAPILIGYGMNFETEEGTRYARGDSPVNVTGLLSNGVSYSYMDANINELNFDNLITSSSPGWPGTTAPAHNIPNYDTAVYRPTSIQLSVGTLAPYDNLATIYTLRVDNGAAGANSNLGVTVTFSAGGSTQTDTVAHVTAIYYSKNLGYVWITNGSTNRTWAYPNPERLDYTNYSGIRAYWSSSASIADANPRFIDISKGWRFLDTSRPSYDRYATPANANDLLITFNLDKAAAGEYHIFIKPTSTDGLVTNAREIRLTKETAGGVTNWYLNDGWELSANRVLLPYNSDISNNSYQVKFTRDGAEVRYIGPWHDTIGPAEYYWSHKIEWRSGYEIAESDYITGFIPSSQGFVRTSMIFRVDAANVLANTYMTIDNVTYDPSTMTNKANPETVISDIVRSGSSIAFGGNTYTVTDGKIRINGRDVPLRTLSFSSTLRGDGQYDNAIGGDTVSVTAAPSAITFNGTWVMGVSTYSQELENYTETHWVPGKFAWNGVDDNFIIVGLMASVGAFIALSVYGRRSGAKVLPLLLVCGGAAFVFLLMI